jgi:hypothetical protein
VKRTIFLLTALFAFSSVAVYAAGATKADGWISDSMCGARHMANPAQCVTSCIKHGAKPVFVDAKKQVWVIDNPEAVKSFYGDRVAISATKDAAKKSVHIESVAEIK